MNDYRTLTILGECLEELEAAAERVEQLMDQGTGRNVVRYQIIGDDRRQPWDSGYITDEALQELQLGYIVIPA